MNLQEYFKPFRENIVGIDATFESPFGTKPLVYADWIASGRLYAPIEEAMIHKIGPLVGNTHSESNQTGTTMTLLYHNSKQYIKTHVNASENDSLLSLGSGMTGALHKLMRILGIAIPEKASKYLKDIPEEEVPVVFITHMEHHSNHTSWLETSADVVVLEPEELQGKYEEQLERLLSGSYRNRKMKIGSFSAGSNVTGIIPDYYKLAEVMHRHGGWAFADFAASAPYVNIDMHPDNEAQRLDAIFFSPHKALGGPGSAGVLIFNNQLYQNKRPDRPGGGTVTWTNRWNEYAYISDIEEREDGGTPPFLQTFRTAFALKLKDRMGVENILKREHELLQKTFARMEKIPHLHILAPHVKERLGVVSFYVENIHHNLIVKLLNDLYGIQVRGGCSCAGTYGHYLLDVSKKESHRITEMINQGDLSQKPGWIRLSLHPTMTDAELSYILDAIETTIEEIDKYKKIYHFDKNKGEFFHKDFLSGKNKNVEEYFYLPN